MADTHNVALRTLCLWQLIVLIGLAACALVFGKVPFYSAILGAVVAIAPSLLFTRYAFRFAGAQQAHIVLRSFYFGEAVKLLSVVAGFVFVFNLPIALSMASFWTGFIVCILLPIVLAATGRIKAQISAFKM
jgi:ATP synthase protein I